MIYRHRFQNKDSGASRQEDKAPDLGHGGAGALPHHHHVVLPRRDGDHARIRHNERENIRWHCQVATKYWRGKSQHMYRGIFKSIYYNNIFIIFMGLWTLKDNMESL